MTPANTSRQRLAFILVSVLTILLVGCDEEEKKAAEKRAAAERSALAEAQSQIQTLSEAITARDGRIATLQSQLADNSRPSWGIFAAIGLAAAVAFVGGLAVGASALRAHRTQNKETMHD